MFIAEPGSIRCISGILPDNNKTIHIIELRAGCPCYITKYTNILQKKHKFSPIIISDFSLLKLKNYLQLCFIGVSRASCPMIIKLFVYYKKNFGQDAHVTKKPSPQKKSHKLSASKIYGIYILIMISKESCNTKLIPKHAI